MLLLAPPLFRLVLDVERLPMKRWRWRLTVATGGSGGGAGRICGCKKEPSNISARDDRD